MSKQNSAAPNAPQPIPYLALFKQPNGPCVCVCVRACVRVCVYNHITPPTNNVCVCERVWCMCVCMCHITPTFNPATFGRRLSSGICTSSITICPVTDALRENLPSIFGAESPFIPFSRMKPLILLSSHLAHTTNTSAIGELVILRRDRRGMNLSQV